MGGKEEEQSKDEENGVRDLEMEITKLRLSNSLSSPNATTMRTDFQGSSIPLKLVLPEQLVDDDEGLDDKGRSMRKPKKTNGGGHETVHNHHQPVYIGV